MEGIDWVAVGSVVTGLASIALAMFSLLLWRVNKHIRGIQYTQAKREDAVLHMQARRLVNHGGIGERGLRFQIWNNGLRDTQIRNAYLEYERDNGGTNRRKLAFARIDAGRPFITAGQDSGLFSHAEEEASVPFIGEFLKSGELWEMKAITRDKSGLRTYTNPHIVIEPVLGPGLLRYPIGDGIHWPRISNWPEPRPDWWKRAITWVKAQPSHS